MNSLFVEGFVHEYNETLMREAAQARLVRRINAGRKERRASRRRSSG